MRLHEINDVNEQTERLLKKYFKIIGSYEIKNGRVQVDGNVETYSSIIRLGLGKLPVQFGVVDGYFYCNNLHLESLVGAPSFCKGFYAFGNNITNLIGGPRDIDTAINFTSSDHLTSLEGLPHSIDGIVEMDYDEKLPMLRLILVKDLQRVDFNSYNDEANEVEKILNKYLRQGKKGAIQCAAELSRAGYKDNARL